MLLSSLNYLTVLNLPYCSYLTLRYLFNTDSGESHTEWFTALNSTWQLVIANVMTDFFGMENDVKGNLQYKQAEYLTDNRLSICY